MFVPIKLEEFPLRLPLLLLLLLLQFCFKTRKKNIIEAI